MQGWSIIESLEEYLAKYRRCKNNQASMALLKRKAEATELTKHVNDKGQFLDFFTNVDKAKSRMGAK